MTALGHWSSRLGSTITALSASSAPIRPSPGRTSSTTVRFLPGGTWSWVTSTSSQRSASQRWCTRSRSNPPLRSMVRPMNSTRGNAPPATDPVRAGPVRAGSGGTGTPMGSTSMRPRSMP